MGTSGTGQISKVKRHSDSVSSIQLSSRTEPTPSWLFFDDSVLHNVVLFAHFVRPESEVLGELGSMNKMDKSSFRGPTSIYRMAAYDVKLSAWCRPDECEFDDGRFEQLKNSINAWGANLQPIKVRRIRDSRPGREAGDEPHVTTSTEIVFGYARLRACLELDVLALVLEEELSDVQALQEYAVEIRGDGRWRPWKLGRVFNFAMIAGMFPSLRRAADTLLVPLSEAALALEMGRLPDSVRLAYRNLELSPTHCKGLLRAYSANPERIELNSTERNFMDCSTAAAVLAKLTLEAK